MIARRTTFAVVIVAMSCGLLSGCVKRTLQITSTPPGALVHVNDQEAGRTPLTMPFQHYGVYDVRLEKEGYEPLWTAGRAPAPWWEHPGPDLIAEAIPGVRSNVAWHYELQPATDLSSDTQTTDERERLHRAAMETRAALGNQ